MKKILLLAGIILSCGAIGISDLLFFFRKKPATEAIECAPQQPFAPVAIRPKVAIFYISNNLDVDLTTASLVAAAKNPDIEAILLLVDHEGGMINSLSTIHDLIKKISHIKPVVGLVTGAALSCGYMMASAANYLIAHSCSEVGNIGVYICVEKHTNKKLTDKIEADISVDFFNAGKYKVCLSPDAPDLTDDQKMYMQKRTDNLYKAFLAIIAENRNLNIDDAGQWADAQTFLSPQAKELGLIDEIGTIFEAEQKLIELIKARTTDVNWGNDMEPVEYATKSQRILPNN